MLHDSPVVITPQLFAGPPPGVDTTPKRSALGRISAAFHTQPHRETLFSFTVGKDVEPSSGKSALEICWETLERVQDLKRLIALHDRPNSLYDPCREQIELSGKLYYFLIRVAGIAGGDVAASKFMDDPRNDCRVRDYLAEDRCPNYLIESFGDVPADGNATLQRNGRYQCIIRQAANDKPWSSFSRCIECEKEFVDGKGEQKWSEFAFCGETRLQQGQCKPKWLAKHPAQCDLSKPEPRFHQVTPKDVDWGESQGLNHPNPSARKRTVYEAKLLADVAAYRAKDRTLQNDALEFKRSAALYWQFCVAFEFPKVCDQKAMGKAAVQLIKTVPREHLVKLMTHRKGKRHYVRHGKTEELTFVRQQDLNLATEV
jgi:hypothetical protein